MYSRKNSKKYLLIFDFDETIVDKDSEEELLKLTFTKQQYDQIMSTINDLDFFEGFNYYFKLMKDIGITLKDINNNLDKLELSPKMLDLFDYIGKNRAKFDVVILSSCIDYSIKNVLKHYGYINLVDQYLCTKAYVEQEKSDKLLYVPKNQFPHTCDICSASQCKSSELEKFLKMKKYNKYEKLLYIGDGENDYCPSKKMLKKGDILFPRDEHRLYSKLKKTNFRDIICDVHPWKRADEIIFELNKLE
jgi:2,3-diketo-5-methylthio-1-phosphopentane phosphatase